MQEQFKNKIQSYLKSNDNRPLVIDVPNIEEREDFLQQYFSITKKSIFDLTMKNAELPEISSLYEYMEKCDETIVIITDLGTYLKLYGQEFLQQSIHILLEKSFTTKFLILTFQCGKYINETSPKNRDKVLVDKEQASIPASLVFIGREYKDYVSAEKSLSSALKMMERKSGEKLYVLTKYIKRNFSNSLVSIDECKNAYDLLCLKDKTTKKISSKFGKSEDWNTLLVKLENNSIEKTIGEFINTKNFVKNIEEWGEKNEFERWLTFIYAKLKNLETENWAINYAIGTSKNSNEFLLGIYESILNLNHKEEGYWTKYDQRKKILKTIKDDTIIYVYCNSIQYKEFDALYYLTDNTENEKKLIIQLIDKYYQSFTKSKLLDLLKHVYKDLYEYLLDFNMKNDFLNSYFAEYKYLKVINHLTAEFKAIVDKEACNRSYKRILMCRSEVLEELSLDKSIVYFVDALGVEFLSYIERKCAEKGLAVNAHIAKANLPSITSENIEFRAFFAKRGIEIKDEKELDELIHDGKNDYDFDKNKLPIHIIEEFNIIDKCITNIRKKLKSNSYKKAIILADHGATRLAILNTDMVKIEVESIGEHGGRVCKAYRDMEVIPNAVIENDYCILGDYNSFKGGRVGKVEMHGGATLEEVVVPIIEITEKTNTTEIKVLTNIIKVSFKTIAVLKFYASDNLDNVTVHINGESYTTYSSDGQNFSAELPDIRRSGEYKFEVWSNDKLISYDNTFKIEKESAKTNNLWE